MTSPTSFEPPPLRALPKPAWAQADLDPDNDGIVAPPLPLADCEQELGRLGAEVSPVQFPLKQKLGDVFTCGAVQAVVYKMGPEGIRYNARPQVTCRLALALSRFEQIAQELAREHLATTIVKVTQVGTYSCRKMTRFAGMVSEHSYANAIDLQAFSLANGRTISVLRHFGPVDEPVTRPEAQFLHRLAERLYDEGVFSVVLTPYFDALHRDHFHLDLARYRVDGTRP